MAGTRGCRIQQRVPDMEDQGQLDDGQEDGREQRCDHDELRHGGAGLAAGAGPAVASGPAPDSAPVPHRHGLPQARDPADGLVEKRLEAGAGHREQGGHEDR
ncbi:hypothetical protein GCM10023081_20210 [Arthrobacter ginkgonis]|uniref:Uncharacterized protein n=1 Tax=Arthrobacter ginkgonis TaxID=1630594 RepID=A0ABP7C734_9MICC